MGNWFCRERNHPIDKKALILFPAQNALDLDWNDEASIHHRTAMNCLDNYALGKIVEESLIDIERGSSRKTRTTDICLKFADEIEESGQYECSGNFRRTRLVSKSANDLA